MHKDMCEIRKKLKNKHFPVRQRPFLRKINLENGGGCGIMNSVILKKHSKGRKS